MGTTEKQIDLKSRNDGSGIIPFGAAPPPQRTERTYLHSIMLVSVELSIANGT